MIAQMNLSICVIEMKETAMKFKPGELIVRDDTTHPKGTLVVDGFDEEGNLQAYPLGGGFHLSIPRNDVGRFFVVTKDEATPIYRRALFSMEGMEECKLAGWTADKRWNGWEMPSFEFLQAMELAQSIEGQLRYDSLQDSFIGSTGDEEEIWPGHFIDLADGGQAKVYDIGVGSWMWEVLAPKK